MALKQEIAVWVEATQYYDQGEFDRSLEAFGRIADTSRILFNCGVIHASLGEHAQAVDFFIRAVARDRYLAIAYFQCGVSNFLLGEFEDAMTNFNDTILCLRGNDYIDYEQLGLKHKLHACEILFNRGLCYIYLQQTVMGMQDLKLASSKKAVGDHDVIDEAIEQQAEGYVVFSIPRDIIYRPHAAKVKNLLSKDYLGKARLVAAQQELRNQPAAPTSHRRNHSEATPPTTILKDRLSAHSYSNTERPSYPSRSRLQSEPPINRRHGFPPTPPPEETSERRISVSSRTSGSCRSEMSQDKRPGLATKRRPSQLELGTAAFDFGIEDKSGGSRSEKPRLGTVRSASERPRARDASSPSAARPEERRMRDVSRRSLRIDTQDEDGLTLKPSVYDAVDRHLRPQNPQQQPQQQQRPEQDLTDQGASLLLQPVTYSQQRSRSKARKGQRRPVSIEEESENDDSSPYPDSAISGIPPPQTTGSTATEVEHSNTPLNSGHGYRSGQPLAFEIVGPGGYSSHAQGNQDRKAEMTMSKIRMKVHGERDTRYVMVALPTTMEHVMEQVRKKFGLLSGEASSEGKTGELRLKMRDDEGDMVTMADEEDLEIAVQTAWEALEVAGRSGEESSKMGKMELWVHEI